MACNIPPVMDGWGRPITVTALFARPTNGEESRRLRRVMDCAIFVMLFVPETTDTADFSRYDCVPLSCIAGTPSVLRRYCKTSSTLGKRSDFEPPKIMACSTNSASSVARCRLSTKTRYPFAPSPLKLIHAIAVPPCPQIHRWSI